MSTIKQGFASDRKAYDGKNEIRTCKGKGTVRQQNRNKDLQERKQYDGKTKK